MKIPHGLKSRPFEFKYTAAFRPDQSEQPIEVVGHRTLILEGIDVRRNPLTGYASVDAKLLEVRNHLRRLPMITAADLDSVLIVSTSLGRLAATVIQDARLEDIESELMLQPAIRDELRRSPDIAGELEEHPHAGGGITDKSFRGIRIELKFEGAKRLTLTNCEAFTAQTASYVVTTRVTPLTSCVRKAREVITTLRSCGSKPCNVPASIPGVSPCQSQCTKPPFPHSHAP